MIKADNLVKIYKTKETEVLALQGLDLVVKKGELTALIGNSGSGKSTFLNMIGGLDRPSAGSLWVDGQNLFNMSERELVLYKRDRVGFVWQNNGRNMLPYLTAIENVMLPMNLSGASKKYAKAMELLEMVGMSHKKNNRMNMLSGGEQQRVAIARALLNSPELILADEPTGNLDPDTGLEIIELLHSISQAGIAVIISTHNPAWLTAYPGRKLVFENGTITE